MTSAGYSARYGRRFDSVQAGTGPTLRFESLRAGSQAISRRVSQSIPEPAIPDRAEHSYPLRMVRRPLIFGQRLVLRLPRRSV